jgi:hypothetical protein
MKCRRQMIAVMAAVGMTAACVTACGSKAAETTAATAAETTAAETTVAETAAAETTVAEMTEAESAEAAASEEVTYEDPVGFSLKYDSADFEATTMDNGIVLRYTGDDYNNFVSVTYTEEYTAEDLAKGLALQSGKDDVMEEQSVFGDTGIESYVVMYQEDEETMMQFNVLPYKDGCLLIEGGAHIYGENEEDGVRVSGIISEVYNSLKLS